MRIAEITIEQLENDGAVSIQTGPFGTQLKASDYTDEGVPVINVRNVGYGDLRQQTLEFVTEETAERLSVHVLEEGDIVFGRKGAVDRHLFVSDSQRGWIQGSDCIRLRLRGDRIVPRFASYSFLRRYHKEWMLSQCGNKATMASLNQDVVRRIVLPFPRFEEQREIVSILSAYDELIENNRRRIALLEEASRLLYREWFVRFRFPGHEHVNYIDGLPEGWRRRYLGDVVTTQYGHTASASEQEIGPKFVRGTDINKRSFIDWSTVPYCPEQGLDFGKYTLAPGDILVIRMADPGKVAFVEKSIRAVFASYLVRLKIRNPDELPPIYMFMTLTEKRYQRFIRSSSGGSTRKSASAKLLTDFRFAQPPKVLLELFVEQVAPMREMITRLVDQSSSAAQARDLLLPRLMNGELAV